MGFEPAFTGETVVGWFGSGQRFLLQLADAILDRIVHDAYMINIQSIAESKDISMREIYGLDKNLRE